MALVMMLCDASAALGRGLATPVDSIPVMARPAYLESAEDDVLESIVTRITGDSGIALGPVDGIWGGVARHVYSVQQPWSSDGSLLVIENRNGGSPSPLFLDGNTYLPRFGPCSNANLWDYRWHPSPAHPHELINVDQSGTQLSWFDVITCTRTRSWTLPITVNYGIGSGEGNPSVNGRFVALGTDTTMFVVDMDPQPPFAPYPSVRIGPVYHLPPESLLVATPNSWTMGNLSISPSGKYIDFKFSSNDDCGSYDMHRIFEVDSATLAIRPHNMATASLRCCSFQSRPNGWIFPLKHADMALDPFDHNEDVIVGGYSCPGSPIGHVVKVRLRDGAVTPLTDGVNESSVYHVSTRNLDNPGWAYVSWFKVDGKRYSDEIIAVKLDGSYQVERLAHTHTAASGCYRCEAHPVPSRDGQRVIFASNWTQDCTVCGDTARVCDYVAMGEPLGATVELATVESVRPNPAVESPTVVYVLPAEGQARLDVFDISGRIVMRSDLGDPGPGLHRVTIGRAALPPPGVYWVRVVQSGRGEGAKMVVLR